jgi:hypothetical protein
MIWIGNDLNRLFIYFQLNEVEMTLPRFVMDNSSEVMYVRLYKRRAFGDHIYAESPLFKVVNTEQDEYKHDADDVDDGDYKYIDFIITPKVRRHLLLALFWHYFI